MNTPYLSICGIAKSFGTVSAVEDVSVDIEKGNFVTFLGPSGSGKSTTLYAIAGLLEPTRGDVLLEGSSLLKRPPNKRNIGMVFQRYTLFPNMTVAGNVAFPLVVRGRPKDEIARKVSAMLRLVRLEGLDDRMPSNMSGGQQQRVALARALAYDPPILLMDEPLSALDKSLREEIQHEIRRIHRETGVTVLYVTHDQAEALYLSDRVAVFNKGRIEQIGTGQDLYERPCSRFVAGFIGDSNLIEGRMSRIDDARARIQFPDGCWLECAHAAHPDGTPESASVMMRPNHLSIDPPGDPGEDGIFGTVADEAFLGDHSRLTVMTRWNVPLTVRRPLSSERSVASRGVQVRLKCAPRDIHVFRSEVV